VQNRTPVVVFLIEAKPGTPFILLLSMRLWADAYEQAGRFLDFLKVFGLYTQWK